MPRARVACKCWHMLLLVQQTQLHRILHVRLLATKILRHLLKYLLNIWKLNVAQYLDFARATACHKDTATLLKIFAQYLEIECFQFRNH